MVGLLAVEGQLEFRDDDHFFLFMGKKQNIFKKRHSRKLAQVHKEYARTTRKSLKKEQKIHHKQPLKVNLANFRNQ